MERRQEKAEKAQSWVLPGCSWTSSSLPAAAAPGISLAKQFYFPLSKQGAEILGALGLRVWDSRPEPCWLLLQPQQVLSSGTCLQCSSAVSKVSSSHINGSVDFSGSEQPSPLSCPSRLILLCLVSNSTTKSREWPLSPALSQCTCKSSLNVVLGQNSFSCPQPISWGLKTD